jgi:hypothetical protein
LVGGGVLAHPGRSLVGWNPASDFQVMTWSLVWWPWTIGHGVDPLRTHLLWAPAGFPTIWLTAIPAVSLLASPLTLTLGPVVTYNVLMFAAVGLAAACAFLLCRELTGGVRASVVGGLLFGLSPYMIGHTLSQHLDLTFVWPVPLIGWAIVRRVRGRWRSGRSFVVVVAALLLVELGTSLELFLDLTLVIGVAFVLALVGARDSRAAVLRIGGQVGLAYCAASPLVAGAAYLALTSPHAGLPYPPAAYSTDLANVVVPTPLSLFGALGSLCDLSRHFAGNIGEQDGYLGLPVIALVALATRAHWRKGGWLAASLLAVVLALSLGPVLSVGGRPLLALPFATGHFPLLADMLPARLSLFAILASACLVAVWLSLERRAWIRVCVAAVVLASVLPNFVLSGSLAGAWAHSGTVRFSTPTASSGFVSAAGWRSVVRPGTAVLVLPTGARTDSLYWQAEADMRFRLAVPATPFVPPGLAAQPTIVGLTDQTLPYLDGDRLAAARLRAYLAAERVGAVVVQPTSKRWRRIAATAANSKPRRLTGSLVYPVRRLLPLTATGEFTTSNAGTTHLRSWLRFDGHRAHVEAALGHAHPVAISAPTADAEQLATAVSHDGRAAVAFTDWRRGVRLLSVATHSRGGGWQTVALDRRKQPIWSPRVRITPDGTTIVSWLDVASPLRLVQVAVRPPNGPWQRPTTLEAADGLAFVDVAASGGANAVLAWRDTLGSEQRVRVATYTPTGWRPPTTAGTALTNIGHLHITRLEDAARVTWTTHGMQHVSLVRSLAGMAGS